MPASVDSTVPEQRIVEAAAVLPAIGAVTGWAALRWLGARWFDGLAPDGETPLAVCLACDDIRPPANAVLSEERLLPGFITEVDGLMITVPIRSVTFEMRYASSPREAAVIFNMAAYDDLVSIAEVEQFLPSLNGWTGVPQLRDALSFVDENSWSPWEDRMANIWMIEAGLAPPLRNRPIFDRAGRHIGTPDLLAVEAGLIGEYNGGLHAVGSQPRHDRDRLDGFREHGLEVVVMMRGDSADRERMAQRILAARRRARFEAESARSWTIVPPAWWIPTLTVTQRRALMHTEHAFLLDHRRAA